MRDLSLHLLDILQNSIAAGATNIEVHLTIDEPREFIILKIIDNGCGMEAEFLTQVKNPFTTTRTTRKVGMGLSLLEAAANRAMGTLKIESEKDLGTTLTSTFQIGHIDRIPMGDIAQTLCLVIASNSEIEVILKLVSSIHQFEMDTRNIKQTLDGVPIHEVEVVLWLKDYMNEGMNNVFGGILMEISG